MFSSTTLLIFAYLVLALPLLAAVLAPVIRRSRFLGWLTVAFSFFSLVFSFFIAAGTEALPLEFTAGFHFYLDELSVYFVLLVNLVAFVASWYTAPFLAFDAQRNPQNSPYEFHFFFNLFHFTMLMVPMVDNLVGLWMAVEFTTIVSTMLVRYRRDRAALEAAWKYIVITTTGIIFALLGTLFLANAIPQGLSVSLNWSELARPGIATQLNTSFVHLSFIFILVGYGTKAGFAPMHTWLPDGHGEAPSPVSALLSGVLLKSALYAILRFYTITNLNAHDDTSFTSTILLASGLFSLALATPFILKDNKFKRVLAYHSLEHMGIITFGVGIGGSVALFGALLHALNHALTKALMFLTFGTIRREYLRRGFDVEPAGDGNGGSGVLQSMPFAGMILALGGLALVGSPPFNIFMSEIVILWAAIEKALADTATVADVAAVAIFLVTVTLIFGGLVKHLSRLLLDRPPFARVQENVFLLAPVVLLIVVILIFGFWVPKWPADFPALLRQSVCILEGGAGACR